MFDPMFADTTFWCLWMEVWDSFQMFDVFVPPGNAGGDWRLLLGEMVTGGVAVSDGSVSPLHGASCQTLADYLVSRCTLSCI